jgi:hypothetical protein
MKQTTLGLTLWIAPTNHFWLSINLGFLYPAKGVQNLFWAVGSPKFILDDSHPCTFNHTRLFHAHSLARVPYDTINFKLYPAFSKEYFFGELPEYFENSGELGSKK